MSGNPFWEFQGMVLFNFLPSFGSRKPKRSNRKPAAKTGRRAKLEVETLESRLVMTANVISGFVFSDLNNNGLFDPGEKPIANSSIVLKNSSGTVIGQAITDANGFYQFSTDSTISTAPAILTKTASIPTTSTDWTQSISVGQFDPSLGTLTSIDIVNAGTFTSDIKVESLDGAPSNIVATVSGTLTLTGNGVAGLVATSAANESFSASAFDGMIDFGGTSGHDFGNDNASGTNSLTLSDPTSLAAYTGVGTVSFSDFAHATSSATGAGNLLTQIGTTANAQIEVIYHYIPSNAIKPGNYTVVQTVEPPGFLDGKDSSNGNVIPNSIGTDSIPVVFTGNTSPNNDFGELLPGSLSGNVYVDSNNNGIKEVNEAGIGGVTVILTNSNGSSAPIATVTAADGSYQFNNLLPGTYSIQETQPSSYLDGKDTLGSLSGTQANDLFTNISLNVGASGINYNFGELLASSLAGKVYIDTNNNGVLDPSEAGIASVTLTLTGTNDLGTSVSATTTTAADGTYTFNGLRPGTYTIVETQPANYLDGQTNVGSLGGVVTNNQIASITLPSGTNGVSYNFGEVSNGTLAGKVYYDANDNGVLDPSEIGIPSVTVTLIGVNDLGNSVSLTATTAVDGTYSFTGLRPGVYAVGDIQPANYLTGKSTAGSNGGVAGLNQVTAITLPVSATATSYNFGFVLSGTLAGTVYVDNNDNGVDDPGEAGIAGVTVILTGTNDQGTPISASTTTAADGSYSFKNLRPGTYSVMETQPANYLDGKTTAGSVGGSAGVNQITGINFPLAAKAVSYNFGELLAGSLAGNVYVDTNNNGIEDPGEKPLGGVTITLSGVNDQNAAISGSTVTAPDGTYSFIGLRPGSYGITETQPTAFNDGKTTLGSLGGQVTPNQFTNVPVQSGQAGVQYNFGELPPIDNSTGNNPFVPININLTFLSKLQLLSNSQQIMQQATQLAYYVDGVYTVTLGRHADTDGLSYFTLQLLRGMSQQAFVSYLLSTPEHMASEITSSYLTILGRTPDSGGLAYFQGLLSSGVSINTINATLLTSPEFQAKFASNQAFVQGLYQAVLGRAPSASDVTFWTGQLAGGTPRMVIAQQILNSPEAVADEINLDYLNILGRNADPGSLNQWVSMIQTGKMTEPQVATVLLCSPEFFNRILTAAGLA
jgi:protocatechuate 3,4-dioxygenase beta subunit